MNLTFTKSVAATVIAIFISCALQSCVDNKAIQDKAAQALEIRDFKTALNEILKASDSSILESDSLMLLLSAAYYGILQEDNKANDYIGRNVYDVDIIKSRELMIVTDFEYEELKAYSYPDLKFIESIKLPCNAYGIDVSPDESKIAVALENGEIMLYDLDTKQGEILPYSHGNRARGVAFKDNDMLFSCSNDQSVMAWNLKEKKPIWKSHVHSRNIKNIRLNRDKDKIITASNDGSSCILYADSTGDRKKLTRLSHGMQYVNDAAISGNNDFAVTVSGDGTIKKWDAVKATDLIISGLGESLCSVDISPDSKLIIAGGNKDVFILDAETLVPIFKIPGDSSPFWTVKFADSGSVIIADSSTIREYELPTKEGLLRKARELKK